MQLEALEVVQPGVLEVVLLDMGHLRQCSWRHLRSCSWGTRGRSVGRRALEGLHLEALEVVQLGDV